MGTLARFTIRASPDGSVSGLGCYVGLYDLLENVLASTRSLANLAPDLDQHDGGQVCVYVRILCLSLCFLIFYVYNVGDC